MSRIFNKKIGCILAKRFHIRKNSSREERERGNYFITVSLSLKLKLSRWEGAAALYFGRAWNSQNQQEQPTTEPKSFWIRLKIAISLPYNWGWNCHNQRRARIFEPKHLQYCILIITTKIFTENWVSKQSFFVFILTMA